MFELVPYKKEGNVEASRSLTAIGYSLLWLIFTLILGGVIILVLAGLSLRKLKPGIPIARGGYSNSLALSAAAHTASDEPDAAFLPLKYGIIRRSEDSDCIERVGFSSHGVDPLTLGSTYVQGG